MSAEQLKIAVKALEDVSTWTFGWDGDCGVTRCADEALSAIEAIAPPVAAGSVDTAEFREVLNAAVMCKSSMQIQCNARLLDHIDAWGVQQRSDGWHMGRNSLDKIIEKIVADRDQWRERAEKAEADASLLRNDRDNLQKLATSRREWAEKAEAELESWVHTNRIDELQRELAHKQAIIDRLMLEFCPDEMTPEQMANWEKHQVRGESRHLNVIDPSDMPC